MTAALVPRGAKAWRCGAWAWRGYADLGEAFRVLEALSNSGHACEYEGISGGLHWVKFHDPTGKEAAEPKG